MTLVMRRKETLPYSASCSCQCSLNQLEVIMGVVTTSGHDDTVQVNQGQSWDTHTHTARVSGLHGSMLM